MLPALPDEYAFKEGAVRYGVSGAGPDLVVVHGTPWSSFSWSAVLPTLQSYFRVFQFDLIGYGQSEMRSGQRVSLDVQGELLGELLDHWSLSAPFVMAHDFGGAISLRTHLLGGYDYARLLLMNVVAIAPWGSPFFSHVQQHEAAFVGVPAYIHDAIVRRYIQGALFANLNQSTLDALVKPWTEGEGQGAFYRQIAQASQRYTDEVEPRYDRLRCPVRILWGENDPWIPIETGRRLYAAIPGAQFHPIARAGHLVQLENPAAVIDNAVEFFGSS